MFFIVVFLTDSTVLYLYKLRLKESAAAAAVKGDEVVAIITATTTCTTTVTAAAAATVSSSSSRSRKEKRVRHSEYFESSNGEFIFALVRCFFPCSTELAGEMCESSNFTIP